MVEIYARLNKAGYTSTCQAHNKGLRLQTEQRWVAAKDVKVDDIIRLEGTSSPSEQVVIFALSGTDPSWKATYSVTHSAQLPAEDIEMMQALDVRGAKRSGNATS